MKTLARRHCSSVVRVLVWLEARSASPAGAAASTSRTGLRRRSSRTSQHYEPVRTGEAPTAQVGRTRLHSRRSRPCSITVPRTHGRQRLPAGRRPRQRRREQRLLRPTRSTPTARAASRTTRRSAGRTSTRARSHRTAARPASTACLTQTQLLTEINSALTANGWTASSTAPLHHPSSRRCRHMLRQQPERRVRFQRVLRLPLDVQLDHLRRRTVQRVVQLQRRRRAEQSAGLPARPRDRRNGQHDRATRQNEAITDPDVAGRLVDEPRE